MAVQVDPTPFGLTALVVAASLLEAMHKRGLVDDDAVRGILENAAIYIQAFGADHPPEVEQEARHILEMLAKSLQQATRELHVEERATLPAEDVEQAIA